MTGWMRLLRDLGPLVRAQLELDAARTVLRAAARFMVKFRPK